MDKTLIVNAMIFDGSGAAPFSGDTLVERIEDRQHERPPAAGAPGLGPVTVTEPAKLGRWPPQEPMPQPLPGRPAVR
jgi:hypothetical protein